jgi:multimeric flavodoxin WrbA
MKILALNASPRKDGNTAKMLKEMTKDHADVDLEYFDLYPMNIKDCQACFYCKKHDGCAIKDDMQGLYKKIKECDALVLGSPIYFGAETASLRAFVDRLYALLEFGKPPAKYAPRLKGKKQAIVVLTCGNPQGKEVYAAEAERLFRTWPGLGFQDVHVYVIGGNQPGADILELTDAQAAVKECQKLLG